MLFTLFLMLHRNPTFYEEFRHTVQDDQFMVGVRGSDDSRACSARRRTARSGC